MRVIGVLAPAAGDQTAPSVPTGLAGVAASGSQIDLTWDPSTDTGGAGLAGYTVYRDGIQIDTVATESYSDTGLAQSTDYDYQVSAFDASGNHSAVSGAITVTTLGNSAPLWNTVAGVPSPGAEPISENTLAENQAYFRDLDDLCSDADGDAITYSESATQLDPPVGYTQGLPPGVTLNAALGTLSGTPTTAGNYAYTIDADDGQTSDMETEWLEHSTAPGVFYANNFEGCTDTASMVSTLWSTGANSNKKRFNATIKRSGPGSCECFHLASDGANEAAPEVRIGFDGKSSGQTLNTSKRRFYLRFSLRVGSVYNNFNYGASVGTPKIVIIWKPNSSFGASEVVQQRSGEGRPMVVGYRLLASGGTVGLRTNYSGISASAYHNFLNNPAYSGPNPPTTNAQLRQLRGYTQNSPANDPDFAHDRTRYPDDEWCVCEWFIDMDAQTIKYWHAEFYGDAPVLSMGTIGNAGFSVSSDDFTGAQFVPRPENCFQAVGGDNGTTATFTTNTVSVTGTTWADMTVGAQVRVTHVGSGNTTNEGNYTIAGKSGNTLTITGTFPVTGTMSAFQFGCWPNEDTSVFYTEIICSDNPIPFPGGHELPYPGTEAPPGYPWAGSSDVDS